MSDSPEQPQSTWRFDPLSAAFARDPYPDYARLRSLDAPYYFADFDVWLTARFSDVARIARDPGMVRSLEPVFSAKEIAARRRSENWHDMPYHSRFVQFSLLDSDGETHRRLRMQVFKLFQPVSISRLRPGIEALVAGLIDDLKDLPQIDFVEDLAAKVPGRVIGELLGVPTADCPQLRTWSEDIVQFFDIDRSDERKVRAERATAEFYHYLADLKKLRQQTPKDDLVSSLISAEQAGSIGGDELISTCMLILMAGHGSTIDALGSGLHSLLRFPDQLRRLRRDPSLMRTAIQEMFRYESPLPFFHRYNTAEISLGGRHFEKGSKFGLLYGAANRDPEAFENPDVFDIGRTPNRHLGFGLGPHLCLGNHISRMNMDIIFTGLLQHFADIRLADGEPEYKRGLSVRGPTSLQVNLRPL